MENTWLFGSGWNIKIYILHELKPIMYHSISFCSHIGVFTLLQLILYTLYSYDKPASNQMQL